MSKFFHQQFFVFAEEPPAESFYQMSNNTVIGCDHEKQIGLIDGVIDVKDVERLIKENVFRAYVTHWTDYDTGHVTVVTFLNENGEICHDLNVNLRPERIGNTKLFKVLLEQDVNRGCIRHENYNVYQGVTFVVNKTMTDIGCQCEKPANVGSVLVTEPLLAVFPMIETMLTVPRLHVDQNNVTKNAVDVFDFIIKPVEKENIKLSLLDNVRETPHGLNVIETITPDETFVPGLTWSFKYTARPDGGFDEIVTAPKRGRRAKTAG